MDSLRPLSLMGILGLLIVLALAGELESARVAGIDIRFRKLALQRIERELDDLSPPSAQVDEPEEEGDEGGGATVSDRRRPPPDDLRAAARVEPMAAVLSFFSGVEQAIESLYAPLRTEADRDASFARKVDLLTQYGVIPASEARIVLDLVGLRNAYVHGRGVDPEEAMRLVAVGARLLPVLSEARRRLGRAFEEQVNQILESIPGLTFARRPVLEINAPGDVHLRPDFLITAPSRIVVEAILITDPTNLVKRRLGVERKYETFEPGEVVIVVPTLACELLERRKDKARHCWLPIDELRAWLEDRVAPGRAGP
jgi:hypothetical protein